MKVSVKILSVLLVLVTLLQVASCGGKTELPEKQLLDNVYKTENFPLPEGMEYVNSMYETADGYIVYGQIYDEQTGYTNRSARLDEGFNFIEYFDVELELEEGVDSWLGDIIIAPDGSFYTTVNTNFYDEATDYWESKNYFVRLDEQYNVVKKVLTTELLGLEPDAYAYLYNITPLENGNLAFISDEAMYIIDGDMQIVFKTTIDEIGAMYFNTLIDTPKGLVIMYNDQDYNMKAAVFDPAAMAFGEPYDFTGVGYGQYYGASGEYDLYYTDDSGIFGYSFDTGEGEELLNYMNSDLNNFYPNQMIAKDDHSFICTTWNYDDSDSSGMVITRLSPVPDEELQPKYIITLGALYMNYNIRNEIFKFNRSNGEYRIVLKDYSEGIQYGEDSEYTYEDAIEKMNGDIAAGNVPDLFICSTELPFDSYASKGLFEDLYKYIDTSDILSREMFEANVLSAYETDGKLYRITPTYSVQGFGGLNKVVGAYKDNWNIDAFMQLAASLPEDATVFQDMTRDSFIQMFLTAMYDEFIDIGTGKCNFNDGTFAGLLEYASTLSETSIFDNIDWSNTDNSFWDDWEAAVYEGRVALSSIYVSSFDSITSMMGYTFRTDDIALLGYPGVNGSPVIADDASAIAISSKSKLKDGAWAFISSLLSPEFQDSLEYGLPVLTSSLEKMKDKQVEDAQERKKRDEENESIGGIDEEFGVMVTAPVAKAVAVDSAGNEIPTFYLNEEYAELILEFIRSADTLTRYDDEILSIVNEEAGRFFEGQCSADQAAEAVQGRVSIYVSENS
ncbi:MAG: carbohydrate ABC transporter substrate-binding protein [Clostridia bacterium]|nr:carbohydrate ABC transporter substrate-binding protein [Clostridia bacterium]